MTAATLRLVAEINEIYDACLARGDEAPESRRYFNLYPKPVQFLGLMLAGNFEAINELIKQLPETFRTVGGSPLASLIEHFERDGLDNKTATKAALRMMHLGIGTTLIQCVTSDEGVCANLERYPYYRVREPVVCTCGKPGTKVYFPCRLVCEKYPECLSLRRA